MCSGGWTTPTWRHGWGVGRGGALAAGTPGRPLSEAGAINGKTLRGSRKQVASGAHLLSAVSYRLGLTLAQSGFDDKSNEITAAPLCSPACRWPGM